VPNTRLIKRRIRSAQNIAKITKAMEMVSASKMRRAQDQVKASRPYADRLSAVLHSIGPKTDPRLHPLLQESLSGVPVLLVISTDRGLCGGLNSNLFKAVLEFKDAHPTLTTIVVGKKAQEFVNRAGLSVHAAFTGLPEKVGFAEALPIAQVVRDGFLNGAFSSVHAVHMEFINTLSQKPLVQAVLPLRPLSAAADTPAMSSEYVFEPNAQEILDWLLPYYIEMEIYQLLLDAKASEHSARMISMQNASNNAKDVVGSLQLEYNKGRQAGITRELIEITTASLSLAGGAI
jgi:F-type H+-transporting ATPase subunit gamma